VVKGAQNLTTVNLIPWISATGNLQQDSGPEGMIYDPVTHSMEISANYTMTDHYSNLNIRGGSKSLVNGTINTGVAFVGAPGNYRGNWIFGKYQTIFSARTASRTISLSPRPTDRHRQQCSE
jgi:hypothetical protein